MDEILAFSLADVTRLTGLSERQLTYWDRTKFFRPTYADDNRRRAYSRVYSFRDVVGLRTLGMLRKEHSVSLQELRKVSVWLQEHYGSPWSSLRFYVLDSKVYFDDPRTGARLTTRPPGQRVFPIAMKEIARRARDAANALVERERKDVGAVTQHRYVVHNAPVLAGTRIPTSAVWNLHEAGYTTRAIIREYPRLRPGDVRAALAHEEERKGRQAS